MKYFYFIIFLLIGLSNKCLAQERERSIKLIIEVYEEAVTPYIERLAKEQVKPMPVGASEAQKTYYNSEVRTSTSVHRDNFQAFGRKVFKALRKKTTNFFSSEDKTKLMDSIELYYKNEFLYLDYIFFENCRTKVNELIVKPG